MTGLRSTDTNVADKNRYYTSIHHVSRADQNCAVLKRAENIMTRRDVVSGQTEGNSARVAEDVLRVEGFSHKSCKFISWVKHHEQRLLLASPLGCGRSDQSRLTFSLSGSCFITFACKTLKADAAHVIMNDDTETGRL